MGQKTVEITANERKAYDLWASAMTFKSMPQDKSSREWIIDTLAHIQFLLKKEREL